MLKINKYSKLFLLISLMKLTILGTSAYAQKTKIVEKNVKFEKILYRIGKLAGISYFFEISNDKRFYLEKTQTSGIIDNRYFVNEQKTITKGSVRDRNYLDLLILIKTLLEKKIIFESIYFTDIPKKKICIYYDGKYDCYEYYSCPKELEELDRFLNSWN